MDSKPDLLIRAMVIIVTEQPAVCLNKGKRLILLLR